MKIFVILFLLSVVLTGCYYDNYSELDPAAVLANSCDTTPLITYGNQISSIMNNNCVGCHSSSVTYDYIELDTYSGTMSAAQSGNMLPCILHQYGYPQMPLNGTQLSPCSIRAIELWIQNNYPQ